LLRHRISRKAADRYWDGLRRGVATVEVVNLADLEVAWAIGTDFPDPDSPLVDRTSFAVMMRLGLRRAASFDDDFAIFRFGPGRRDAFRAIC
jgi:predicted nucleic acid-binding protein